ncbi:MAG: hypothetical protein U0X75_02590 [Acidobacteriota bacterium]
MRRTHTDYNQASTYINRRIIGLPTASLYDGANALFSKVEYFYDESGYLQATSATPTQHDSTNYGISFFAGRGNQTTVRRYDVTTAYVEWKTGYNITGSPTFSRDPRYSVTNAQTTISYTDAWVNVYGSNLPNLNTFAYPTTVTDMDGYSSTMKYDFDLGAVRFVTDPKGAVTMSEYDGYGRRWKTTSGYGSVSPFYTSLSFDAQANWVKSYSALNPASRTFIQSRLSMGTAEYALRSVITPAPLVNTALSIEATTRWDARFSFLTRLKSIVIGFPQVMTLLNWALELPNLRLARTPPHFHQSRRYDEQRELRRMWLRWQRCHDNDR